MESDSRFYWSLAAFFVLAIAAWLIGLGALADYLFHLIRGLARA